MHAQCAGAKMCTLLPQVPLDIVDLSHVSILYTQGDMAAITPIYDYNFQVGLNWPLFCKAVLAQCCLPELQHNASVKAFVLPC